MTILLIIACLYIGGCALLVHGGSKWIGTPYFKLNPVSEKLPANRWIAVTLAMIGFGAYVLVRGLNPYLAPVFGVGWYLTFMMGWGRIFSIQTWGQAGLFFARMLESVILFIPLSLIYNGLSWDNVAIGGIFAVFFSAAALLTYTAYNYLPPKNYYGNSSLNLSELETGMLIMGLSLLLIS